MPENPGATIAEHFSNLEDPRMDRTKLHPLKKVMVALRFVSAGRRHILITWHLCINRSNGLGFRQLLWCAQNDELATSARRKRDITFPAYPVMQSCFWIRFVRIGISRIGFIGSLTLPFEKMTAEFAQGTPLRT